MKTNNLYIKLDKQINKLGGSVNKQGFTLVVLKMYFNNKGYVKVEIVLGMCK